MNETGTAARASMNPTETEQRAETQILRPSFRLISGLENTHHLQWIRASRQSTNHTPCRLSYTIMSHVARIDSFANYMLK